MSTLARALWTLRVVAALAFLTIAVLLFVHALRIPLEAGSVIFAPLMFLGSMFFLSLAVGCIVPSTLRMFLGDGAFFS